MYFVLCSIFLCKMKSIRNEICAIFFRSTFFIKWRFLKNMWFCLWHRRITWYSCFCIEIDFFVNRRWVHTSLARPVEMRYNPYTQTIEVIDSVRGMESLVTQMRNELNHLNSAIKNINLSTGWSIDKNWNWFINNLEMQSS